MISPQIRRSWLLFLLTLAIFGLLTPLEANADPNERTDRPLFGTISSGVGITCAVTAASEVKCWGINHVGQLGIGNQTDSLVPAQVQGLSGPIESVLAATYTGCAVVSGGGVKCWGSNSRGQLGDGSRTSSNVPVNVVGLASGVKSVAGVESGHCALLHNGEVKCWGEIFIDFNNDGSEDSSDTPLTIPGLPQDVVAISAGSGKFYCVVSTSTGVWCWGANSRGQLGDGTIIDRFTPVQATTLNSAVKSLSSGPSHSCIVANNGAVKCWGLNLNGQLGDGTRNNSSTPVDVAGLSGPALAVSAGFYHTCALLVSGTVQCWGWNASGQLGNGSTIDSDSPVTVQGLTSTVEALTTGNRNSCVLLRDGELKCWGDNTYGQLGDGTDTNRSLPVTVLNFVGATTTTSTTTSSTTTTQSPAQTTTTTATSTTVTASQASGYKKDILPTAGREAENLALWAFVFIVAGIIPLYRRRLQPSD